MINSILVIDDESEIRRLLRKFLIQNEYIVLTASDTTEARELLRDFTFDIIIMDVMMPNESGTDFLSNNSINTPVIILSALGMVEDRIIGLESGAQDYIKKPFEPKELLLRIKNIIKNHKTSDENYQFKNFTFNTNSSNLMSGDKTINLTDHERLLMKVFISNVGKVIPRDELLRYFTDSNSRTIDVKIARLRNKIEDNPKYPEIIQTIRGIGYIFWGSPIDK